MIDFQESSRIGVLEIRLKRNLARLRRDMKKALRIVGRGSRQMDAKVVRALEELNPMGGEAAKLPPRSGSEPQSEPQDVAEGTA